MTISARSLGTQDPPVPPGQAAPISQPQAGQRARRAATALRLFAALLALLLGICQLRLAKGTGTHRIIGYAWVVLMLAVAASGLFIHQLRLWGPFSPIHLLSFVVLATVPLAIYRIRSGNVAAHARGMRLIFWTALVGAGLFTLLPGRIFGLMLFGSQ